MTITAPERDAAPTSVRTNPPDSPEADAADRPRPLRSRTLDDIACLGASAVGSFAFTWLCYEYLLPFSGLIGFIVGWYFAFLALYIGVTSLSNPRTVVVDRIASTAIQGAAVLTGVALVSAVAYPFFRGYLALEHANFYSQDMGGVSPTRGLDSGGIWHAIIGTLIEIGIAVVVTLPLGIGTAIYMTEVGGRGAVVVRTVVEAMTALPSIIAGLFVFTVLIVDLGFPQDGFAAAMALSIMMLPIMARASEVVLRVVPGGLREASQALGASRWQTVWRVVLPTARPGLATALILAIARGVGETSPVLLTSGASTFFNKNPFSEPMNSLPLFVYEAVRSGEPIYIERGFGAACVLIALVLVLFIVTRLLARQRVSR
ncbi:MAG TPA: phosphate ABC transporter permease PstA [Jatrophihabitantaceae bacterium]|jgi:phosphate transport system permease protein|nr:phosphate ABC transporter permease PstA [Jatrophihabitantaceae bacterium]